MEKQKDGTPLREHIREFDGSRKLAESLKPLELTNDALIFTRHGFTLAMPEEVVKQLEKLAKMSTKLDRRDVYELWATGMGEINGKLTSLKELILPAQDRILVVRRFGDIETARSREPKSALEEYMRIEEGKDRSNLLGLLQRVINKGREDDVKLLQSFEGRFSEIFTRKDMTLDKILGTPWEIIANTNRIVETRHYLERLRESPHSAVFGMHIHLNNLRPSPYDIYADAGPRQRIDWTGIMLVRRESWWDTRIRDENFAVYHSDINNARWLRRIIMQLSDAEFNEPYFMQDDFISENRARMTKYGELCGKV